MKGSIAQTLATGLYASTVRRKPPLWVKPLVAYAQARCKTPGQGAVATAGALRAVGMEGRVAQVFVAGL